jgi:hypothetical protein
MKVKNASPLDVALMSAYLHYIINVVIQFFVVEVLYMVHLLISPELTVPSKNYCFISSYY